MKKLPPVLLCLALALPATANVVHFPGLWQSRFNAPTAYGFAVAGDASNNTVPVLASNLVAVTASDYLDRTPGLLMGYSAGSGPAPKQNPISGRSWGWYNYDVYAYEGEMFVEAGRTYQFYGRFDDGEALVVDGKTVVHQGNASGYNANPVVATSYTATKTGWVPFNAWIWDWTGGKNVMNCRFALQYNPTGTPSTSYSDASVWKELADPGDMSLFRVAGTNSFTTLSSVAIAPNETDFELEISFEGLPAAAAVYACYGAFDGGMATSAWDHVAQVGTAAAGTSTEIWTLPGAVGAKELRLYVEGAAGVATFFTEWTERTALTADPLVSLDGLATSAAGVTASANLLSLGVGATSDDLLLDVATAEDGFDAPAFTFACADNPVTARGVHPIVAAGLATNTTYWFRARATNELGGAGVSAASSLALRPTAPAGTYAFAGPSGATLSGRATVSAFGDDSAWAKVRLEAASDAAFRSIVAASPEASAEIGEPVSLEIVGLDYNTAYFVRLRIVNDWGLETFIVDDELRTTDEAPFSPLMVYSPGLIQAKIGGSAMNRTTDILSHSTATNVPGAIMASTSGSAVNPYNGKTNSWDNNTTFGYVGQMYMTGGTTYWFGKYIDDSGDVTVDGVKIMQNDAYNALVTASCTPERTGWHDVEFRFGNGSGGAGCVNSTIGFGFNTNGISSFTADTFMDGGPWSKAVDPGDCSLLRTVYSATPFFSVEGVAVSGADLVATVSFAGIPEGACDFTAFFGAVNGGFDPGHWASSALVTNPPAGDSAPAQYVVPGAADAAFVAFRLAGTAGTNGVAIPYVQWGMSFNLAQESPSFGISLLEIAYTNATIVASCTGLGAGADSVEAELQISTTRDFAGDLRTIPLSLAGLGSQSLAVNGFTTNTTYYVRVVGENSRGEAGASSPVVLTTLDPQPPEGAASFSGRGFTSLSATASVSTFGTGSDSATIRFEASTNGFETVAAASTNLAAVAGSGALIAVPGLDPATAYALRLRIENEWGLVVYVPIDGEYFTREAPLASSGIGYTVSDDRKTIDISFGVMEVFDGATLTATLEYGGRTLDERTFSQPGPIAWTGIPAERGVQTAIVTVTSVVDGTTYAQTWTATIDLRYRAYAISRLADLSGLALNAGDTVTLPEPTGADDYYAVMDIRSFGLGEDGITLTALEPGFSAVLLMRWNAATGAFEADPGRALALCVPEPEGNGRVFFARPGSGNMNWADSAAWRNLTDGTPDYPHLANDVAMAALPSGQLVLNANATVAELYVGEDESHLHGTVRLTGMNSATLTFRRSSGKPGLFRLTGHGRIVAPVLTNGWTEVHIGGGSGDSTSTGLGIEMPGGLVFDGGAWPDYTAWDSDEMKNFGRARYIMGDNMRFWNIPSGKTLRVVNTYSRYKMTGDDQGGNANFVWNNGGQVTGRGTLLYDGAASTYIDDPFYLFEGTVAVRNKQKYDNFSFGSRGGSFWMVNWTQRTRTAPNATLLAEGDVAYSGHGSSYGVVAYGNSHGYGSWGWEDNALPGKAWILNGGTYRSTAMNNNDVSWREDGTTATQPVCVPNGAETLVVSNGFSCISLGQNGDADRPTNSVAFARLEHAGDGTLRVGTDRTYNSYQTNPQYGYWRVRAVLGGFHDHAIGGTGHAVSRHGDASVRTNILEATAPIVPWIVTDVQYGTSLYFPGADDETDEIVVAGHPKATVLDETSDPKANVRCSGTSLALTADRTVNSLVVQNNYNKVKDLGANRRLTISSGGLIVGDGNHNNTGIGSESGFKAGTAGTVYFPRKAYIYCPTPNDAENNHPSIWAKIVAPKGAVFSFPGDLHLGGDQTGIDDHIAVNGTDLRLGNATTGCEIDVPVHLYGASTRLSIGRQGSFCKQDLHFWDHGTPGAKFVPAPGTQEVVRKMWIDGVSMPRGYYGTSEAAESFDPLATVAHPAFVDDRHFSGTGWIKVMTDEVLQPTLLFLR